MRLNAHLNPVQGAPLALLRELSASRKSGEFVCANPSSSIHIYLRSGCIAWGTSSADPLGFGRQIMLHCGLSKRELGTLVRTCQRDGKTLGEGLSRSGLTDHKVRCALRAQAEATVRALITSAGADCAFFERGAFEAYPMHLSFSLEELLTPSDGDASGLHLVGTSRATSQPGDRARKVFEDVRGCVWAVEVGADGSAEGFEGSGDVSSLPVSLRRLLRNDHLDFVGARNAHGAIVGARGPAGEGSVWCGMHDGALFGAAYTMVCRAAGLAESAIVGEHVNARTQRLVAEDTAFCANAEALCEHETDVLAVCQLSGSQVLAHVSRQEVLGAGVADLLTYAAATFADELFTAAAAAGASTCFISTRDAWIFGVKSSAHESQTAWLVTRRGFPQDLGWSKLSTLVTREFG
jgi:hypothetical protein